MKLKILILSVLFVFLTATPFLQMQESNILVFYHQKDHETALITLEVLKNAQMRLQKNYGLQPRHIQIYIAGSASEYEQLAGSDSPVWSSGLASGDRMLVKSLSFSRQTMKEFRSTLIHEHVHLSLSPYTVPVWFNEGLAQYEAGTFDLQQKIQLSRALMSGSLMSLWEIEGLYEMPRNKAGLAYAQSVAAVDLLISRYGPALIEKNLYFTEKYSDFSLAFRNTYLMSPEHFEKILQQSFKQRYRFYILLDINGMFWLVLTALFILGYVLTRIRRYRLMRKWEQEEVRDDFNENGDSNGENEKIFKS
jgi:hypothetical protein